MIDKDDALEFYKKNYVSLVSHVENEYDEMTHQRISESYFSYGRVEYAGVIFKISAERYLDPNESEFAKKLRHIPLKIETENFLYILYLQSPDMFRRGYPIQIGNETHRCRYMSHDFHIKTNKDLVEEELVIMKLI